MLFLGANSIIENQGYFEQYQLVKNYSYYKRLKDAKGLRVGDIVVSKSGNFRLVLKAYLENRDRQISFLSWLKNGEIKIQSTKENLIAEDKIDGVIRRVDCNPLINFVEEVNKLSPNSLVLKNLSIILGSNKLGVQFSRAVQLNKRDENGCCIVSLVLDKSGEIEKIISNSQASLNKIEFKVSKENSNESEFIINFKAYSSTSQEQKNQLIWLSILANLFINAKRLFSRINIVN